MNRKEKLEICKRKQIELEEKINQLNNHKLTLIYLLNEFERRKAALNKESVAYLIEEISYIDYFIKQHKEDIKVYESKVNALGEAPHQSITTKTLISYAITIVILTLMITGLFVFKPATTGFVVLSKETAYNQSLNLEVNESGNYTVTLNNLAKIKSIKASGSVIGNGSVKIFIEKDGELYLIYKNK